ncbi:endospore germination permease [Camelliibacillus cellulosilyticus]|uniref:Endospore germination permease n=1 Tax=Camelliibacillus cellulosilyticus TaxID=2174486 RepID=A0ABV9GQS5_9BACL
MIEKGKISTLQMAIVMYLMVGGTSILIIPSITAEKAGRDMWVTPMIASLSGFLLVWVAWKLFQLFPNQSIIGLSEKILSRPMGKILSFILLFFLMHNAGLIIREYGEFIVGAFLPRTPLVVAMGSIVLVCAFAVRGGIEVIARSTEIFIPIIITFSLIMTILVIPELDVKNILPLMENGWKPLVEGSVVPHIWFADFVLLTFLLPLLNNHKKALSRGMISVFALMITMVISSLICLFVMGTLTANLVFPLYSVGRYISIAEFLEHLDAVVLAIWVGAGFIQISMWLYVIVLGTAQWLRLSDYRPLVFPIGWVLTLLGLWVAPSLQDEVRFFSTSLAPYCFLILGAYPILLLCVGLLRKRLSTGKKKAQ